MKVFKNPDFEIYNYQEHAGAVCKLVHFVQALQRGERSTAEVPKDVGLAAEKLCNYYSTRPTNEVVQHT